MVNHDYRPTYLLSDETAIGLAETVFDASPGDFTPILILADRLQECDDPRHERLREAVELESYAVELDTKVGDLGYGWNSKLSEVTDYANGKDYLNSIFELSGREVVRSRGCALLALFGSLTLRWCPSGFDGVPMFRTWSHELIGKANRLLWLWSVGLVDSSHLPIANDFAGDVYDLADRSKYETEDQRLKICALRCLSEVLLDQTLSVSGGSFMGRNYYDSYWHLSNVAWNHSNADWLQVKFKQRSMEEDSRKAIAWQKVLFDQFRDTYQKGGEQ